MLASYISDSQGYSSPLFLCQHPGSSGHARHLSSQANSSLLPSDGDFRDLPTLATLGLNTVK